MLPSIPSLYLHGFDIEWPRDLVEKERAISKSRRCMVRRDKVIKLALMLVILAFEAVSLFSHTYE